MAGLKFTAPENHLPFNLPEGYGAVVINNSSPGKYRNTFFEQLTNTNYYRGTSFEQLISTSDIWYVNYWDPSGRGGDYVAVFGFTEGVSTRDILRALINTPRIWFDKELHTGCP